MFPYTEGRNCILFNIQRSSKTFFFKDFTIFNANLVSTGIKCRDGCIFVMKSFFSHTHTKEQIKVSRNFYKGENLVCCQYTLYYLPVNLPIYLYIVHIVFYQFIYIYIYVHNFIDRCVLQNYLKHNYWFNEGKVGINIWFLGIVCEFPAFYLPKTWVKSYILGNGRTVLIVESLGVQVKI